MCPEGPSLDPICSPPTPPVIDVSLAGWVAAASLLWKEEEETQGEQGRTYVREVIRGIGGVEVGGGGQGGRGCNVEDQRERDERERETG